MPATATRRHKRSVLVTAVLISLGALWISPMGCGSGTDRTAPHETSSQSKTSESTTDRSILLNLGLLNRTCDRLSEQFLVETPRAEHWRPRTLEGGLKTKAFEKYPVGESNMLYLYPKGKEGPRLAVPFTMKSRAPRPAQPPQSSHNA